MITPFERVARVGSRLLLGGILLISGLSKARAPAAFAETLANYRLLPPVANQITAVVLPWWELGLGVLLVLGLWVRSCSAFSTLLFATFLGAVASALVRHLDIGCGCFGTASASRVSAVSLLVDASLLALALGVTWLELRSGSDADLPPKNPALPREKVSL